jgi:hypothetical protein
MMTSLQLEHNYIVQWHFRVRDEEKRPTSFLKFYSKSWSQLMRSALAQSTTASQKKALVELRSVVKNDVLSRDYIHLLFDRNRELAQLLASVTPLFDLSPRDLKVFILSKFDLDKESYLEMISQLNKEVDVDE